MYVLLVLSRKGRATTAVKEISRAHAGRLHCFTVLLFPRWSRLGFLTRSLMLLPRLPHHPFAPSPYCLAFAAINALSVTMPKGLHQIPRHHMYGAGLIRRQMYNSNDFQDEGSQSASCHAEIDAAIGAVNTVGDPSRHGTASGRKDTKDETGDGNQKAKAKDSREKEKKKNKRKNESGMEGKKEKKKKRRRSAYTAHEAPAQPTEESDILVPQTPEPAKPGSKSNHKEGKSRKSKDSNDPDRQLEKKRKRQSETVMASPQATVTPGKQARVGFVVGEGLVDEIEASMNNGGLLSAQRLSTPLTSDKSPKKGESRSNQVHIKLEPRDDGDFGGQDNDMACVEKPKVKKHKKHTQDAGELRAMSSSPNVPQKTPALVPKLPELPLANTSEPPSSEHKAKFSTVKAAPTPKLNAGRSGSNAPKLRVSKRERATVVVSPPSIPLESLDLPQLLTPGRAARPGNRTPVPTVANALTDANLVRFTQPLNDEPKPRPRPRTKSFTTTSTPGSQASSMSIQEAFARAARPYARSGALVDPFTKAEEKLKKHKETHPEASKEIFDEKFEDLQRTVNFFEEQECLNEYSIQKQAAEGYELPCLGRASGCTAKKEEILRLSKEENISILAHLNVGGNAKLLDDFEQSSLHAQELLMLSIRARVPVPVGPIEGQWALYCPKYASSHTDKYGYGRRKLSISSIAGFKSKNFFTARLTIPPRTMTYSIRMFATPPHASFRTIVVKTAAEGYKMEVTFLGNGYLQLRADVKLLLQGKESDKVEGKKALMEFVGVHEKATKWWEEEDEIAEEVKKLYGSDCGE